MVTSNEKLKPKNIKIVADDKVIEVKKPSKRHFDLNVELKDPAKFREFVSNPKQFVKKYDFDIDKDISDHISEALKDFQSADDLRRFAMIADEGTAATLWAVARGIYSVASTKIAVAF